MRPVAQLIVICSIQAFAPKAALSYDVVNSATTVIGLHDGKCGPARVAQVVRAIDSLRTSDFVPKRPCKCGSESHAALVRTAIDEDQYIRNGNLRIRYNVLLVTPSTPIAVPMPKMRRSVMAEELFISAVPYVGQTTVWTGYRLKPGEPLIFNAFRLDDDRFHLGRAAEECATGD